MNADTDWLLSCGRARVLDENRLDFLNVGKGDTFR